MYINFKMFIFYIKFYIISVFVANPYLKLYLNLHDEDRNKSVIVLIRVSRVLFFFLLTSQGVYRLCQNFHEKEKESQLDGYMTFSRRTLFKYSRNFGDRSIWRMTSMKGCVIRNLEVTRSALTFHARHFRTNSASRFSFSVASCSSFSPAFSVRYSFSLQGQI